MPARVPALKHKYTRVPVHRGRFPPPQTRAFLPAWPFPPCVACCQLHPAHIIVIDLQAFFLWHHSKDCIQVQHNLTRYKKGRKKAFHSPRGIIPFRVLSPLSLPDLPPSDLTQTLSILHHTTRPMLLTISLLFSHMPSTASSCFQIPPHWPH